MLEAPSVSLGPSNVLLWPLAPGLDCPRVNVKHSQPALRGLPLHPEGAKLDHSESGCCVQVVALPQREPDSSPVSDMIRDDRFCSGCTC